MEADFFADAEVISSYTTQQAVEDGMLVPVGQVGECPVYFTRNCFERFDLEDDKKRRAVVEVGLAALRKPDREDDGYRKLRAFNVNDEKVWVILDGQGVTFMRPEDY